MRKLHPSKVRKSLVLFIYHGIVDSISTALFDPFFTPFLVVLGATNMQIGIITSAMYFSRLIKLPASEFLKGKSNKKANIISSIISILATISFFSIPLLTHSWFIPVIASVILIYSSAAIRGLSFTPWFISLIPKKYLNRYRSKRITFMLLISIPLMIFGSLYLRNSSSFTTYAVVFSISVLFASIGTYIKSLVPEKKIRETWKFGFDRKILKFLPFEALFWFGVGIGGSFIFVYFMRNLGMSVLWVVGYTAISKLVRLTMYKDGMFAEMADSGKSDIGLVISTAVISAIPLIAIFSYHPALFLLGAIADGFGWSGYNMFRWDYILRLDKNKIKQNFAVLDSVANASMMLGAFAGGIISSRSILSFDGIIIVFILSFALRIMSSIYAYFTIKSPHSSVRTTVNDMILFYRGQ